MARLLTIMGSGETTPTMVPVHRSVLERFGGRPRLVVIDTPYGFQENADELTERVVSYFRTSLPGAEVAVASLRSSRIPAGERERALVAIREADVAFAGPGSPTYALAHWADTGVPGLIVGKLRDGGAVTMASAASITLGRFALPVYEIYKVGADPFWREGLDALRAVGIDAVVVPHWDNAEGGTHDTSHCWVGARRFGALRGLLPPEVAVLGVDEHTACLLDLEADTLTVAGRGTVTVIKGAEETTLATGDQAPLDLLRTDAEPGPVAATGAEQRPPGFEQLVAAFETALGGGDIDGALDAILELEDAHERWPAPQAAAAHAAVRGMVTRLGTAVGGLREPELRAHAVETLLRVRGRARRAGRWEDADAIRDALRLLSVEVQDTPEGSTWIDAGSA